MYRINYLCKFYDCNKNLIAKYLTVKNYARHYSLSTLKHRLYNCFTKASKMLEQLNVSKYDWELTVIEQIYQEETDEIYYQRNLIYCNTQEEWETDFI